MEYQDFFDDNSQKYIAMLKINSNVPAAYVSPAVKWVNTRTRGGMCTSPYGEQGAAGKQGSLYDNDEEEDF